MDVTQQCLILDRSSHSTTLAPTAVLSASAPSLVATRDSRLVDGRMGGGVEGWRGGGVEGWMGGGVEGWRGGGVEGWMGGGLWCVGEAPITYVRTHM